MGERYNTVHCDLTSAEAERDDLQRIVDMVRRAGAEAEADPLDLSGFRLKMQPALNAIAAMDAVVASDVYRLPRS